MYVLLLWASGLQHMHMYDTAKLRVHRRQKHLAICQTELTSTPVSPDTSISSSTLACTNAMYWYHLLAG
jgi:hypothetical protein